MKIKDKRFLFIILPLLVITFTAVSLFMSACSGNNNNTISSIEQLNKDGIRLGLYDDTEDYSKLEQD